MKTFNKKTVLKDVDVCLLLEGTYPFVAGGVSTWVHNLIKALPEITFMGLCILPNAKEKWEYQYEVTDNFVDLQVIYLHDYNLNKQSKVPKEYRKKQIKILDDFHHKMMNNNFSTFEDVLMLFQTKAINKFTAYDMIHGKDAWNLMVDLYNNQENHESFIDYFWTYRYTHLPVFKILGVDIPKAKVYHAVSTGYAGLLGSMAKQIHKRPFFITEHGIYTKERKIEISQADWISTSQHEDFKVKKDLGTFQKLWINLFSSLGSLAYQEAESIYTLFEGNRQLEIADGADPDKVFVIPNGINIEKFSALKPLDINHGKKTEPLKVGFVGRVVPIKDVKTFIRACKIVTFRLPNVQFYIMGPTSEDKMYYKECLELVDLLHINNQIEFTGKINVMDYYPILDLNVLTSISEAQPLVILESACAGIPSVASDVGSCRELLEGRKSRDKALGHSGIITRVAEPADTANAIIKILSDDILRQRMSTAGRKRVELFYRESDLNKQYMNIYKTFIKAPNI